jgi:hypothetical protein
MLKFGRFLREETKVMWCKLLDVCSQIQLKDEPGRVSWLLTKSDTFSVKSMYFFVVAKKFNYAYKTMWTLKLPLRIKVLCRLVIKNRILTKENLKKKGWKRVELCEFRDDHETQEHMFLLCPLAKYI